MTELRCHKDVPPARPVPLGAQAGALWPGWSPCEDPARRREAAARVSYEERRAGERPGRPAEPDEIFRRFPRTRDELSRLLDGDELVRPRPTNPSPPDVGDTLGEYRLQAVLGRGQRGSVFLARQWTLGDRPVVLKVTQLTGGEHLSLARLRHPHVVPLYAAHDFPWLGLRALCMPYLGGVTLDRVLDRLADRPAADRRGSDLPGVLDEARTELDALPAWSGPREFFEGATYPRAVCWVGACLAEALHAAHARGLLHLDLKPSNVLLADDGQPMLLDFHLAHGPLVPGDPHPARLGGTEGYMSSEHEAALNAVNASRPVPVAVDERSDIYSLGVTLYESLSGALPSCTGATALELLRRNPRVGPGLAAIVARCLAPSPSQRYPNSSSLAADLRRHLNDLTLPGIPHRGPFARWFSHWRANRSSV